MIMTDEKVPAFLKGWRRRGIREKIDSFTALANFRSWLEEYLE